MNQKKLKLLRKQAKEIAIVEETFYTQGEAFANGAKYIVKTTAKVNEECFRGAYLKLKKEASQ